MPKPTSNQIQNKSLVPGSTVTDALNSLRVTSGGGSGSGDMVQAVYDTDADGKVNSAELADAVEWTGILSKPSTFPPQTHSHAITDVTNLQTTLDGKASSSHTHSIANVTGLQTALDGKAPTSHGHVISDVTGLSTALGEKAVLASDNTFTGSVTYSGLAKRFQADFSNATVANRLMFQTMTANSNTALRAIPSGTATASAIQAGNSSDPSNSGVISVSCDSTQGLIQTQINGTGSYLPINFATSGITCLNLALDGTIIAVRGALGYGAGAGGTVTQATSKSTAVTLNKPSGQITTNNAALAASATVVFQVNNSFVGVNDVVYCNVTSNGNYIAQTQYVGSGLFLIRLTNISAGSLSEAVVINFATIKASNT